MATQNTENLVRKQFLITQDNVNKLALLSTRKKTSAADVVRLAIDAYNPSEDVQMPELMELVSTSLKEAIDSTEKAAKKVEEVLDSTAKKELH